MNYRIAVPIAILCVVVLLILPLLISTERLTEGSVGTATSVRPSPPLPEHLTRHKLFSTYSKCRAYIDIKHRYPTIPPPEEIRPTPEEWAMYDARAPGGFSEGTLVIRPDTIDRATMEFHKTQVVRVINSTTLECVIPDVTDTFEVSLLGLLPPISLDVESAAREFIDERLATAHSVVLVSRTGYLSGGDARKPYLVYVVPTAEALRHAQMNHIPLRNDGDLLNAEIIWRGLARFYAYGNFSSLGQDFLREVEAQAREDKVGMWAKSAALE